jgi:hypothetical protein
MDQPVHPPLDQHAEGGEEHKRREETVYLCSNSKIHLILK